MSAEAFTEVIESTLEINTFAAPHSMSIEFVAAHRFAIDDDLRRSSDTGVLPSFADSRYVRRPR
jgi:hypothetical protein